jgi:hypothetical protein
MKKLVVIIIICLMTLSSYCQTPSIKPDMIKKNIRKNSIFFELGGNGFLYSINYERLIPISKKKGMGLRDTPNMICPFLSWRNILRFRWK